MANRYIEAMLPTLPGPVDQLVPAALVEYLEALDALAGTPGPLGAAAKERADALRPGIEAVRARPRTDWRPGGLERR